MLDPAYTIDIVPIIKEQVSYRDFSLEFHPFHSDGKAVEDWFTRLPAEMIYEIVTCLPIENVSALMRASTHVNNICQDNIFWKQLIRSSILPWFWELRHIFHLISGNINYKRLFLWLEHITRPRFGMKGPFMGVANRRRIWNVCEEVGVMYFREARKRYAPGQDGGIARAEERSST